MTQKEPVSKKEYEELKNKIKKLRKNLALEIELTARYHKALEEIEEYLKLPLNVCLTDCPEYSIGQGCSQNCLDNRLKVLLDIINKAKGEGNE